MARIRVRSPKLKFSLWLPLFLIWLLLLPIVVVLLPFVLLACLFMGTKGFRALAAGWQLLCGLRGTRVDINEPGQSVLLHIF